MDHPLVPAAVPALRFDPAATRDAFHSAGTSLVELAGRIAPHEWDAPGVDDWTVRDLAGHTGRALTTVTGYLAKGAGSEVTLHHCLDYAAAYELGHAHPAAIIERGRQAGADLGDDPATTVRSWLDEAVAAVSAHDDDSPVASPVGVMRLVDYLPCRILELVVHTDDIAHALDREASTPAAARHLATCFAAGLAAGQRDDDMLLRALTGRGTLVRGFSAV